MSVGCREVPAPRRGRRPAGPRRLRRGRRPTNPGPPRGSGRGPPAPRRRSRRAICGTSPSTGWRRPRRDRRATTRRTRRVALADDASATREPTRWPARRAPAPPDHARDDRATAEQPSCAGSLAADDPSVRQDGDAARSRSPTRPHASASSAGSTSPISVSKRANVAASATHDHAPSVTRQRPAPSGSTLPSPTKGSTSRAGAASTTLPRQGQRSTSGEPLNHGSSGQRPRREARAAGGPQRHAVDAEDPPVVAVEVPGHEVPAAAARHDVVRLGPPSRRGSGSRRRCVAAVGDHLRRVVEPHHLAGPSRRRERDQRLRRDRWMSGAGVGACTRAGAHASARASTRRHRRELEHVEPVPQARGHDLPHRRQGPERRLLDAGPRHGGELQRHGQRDHLLVVEQQGRQLAARLEPVAAVGALHGVDAVAHLTQTVDVAAHGPGRHGEPVGEHLAGPVAPRLQQREHEQQAGGRRGHELRLGEVADRC
jgi:hypothetical protein